MSQGGVPLSEWSGSGATRELEQTIRTISVEATKQTRQLIRLTWAIAALTLVMTVGVVVQICPALRGFD